MRYQQLLEEIKNLKIGERKLVYNEENNQIIIYRPEKLGKSLKNKDYEVSKNFQIILKKPNEEEFLPNHLRILIEFNHKMKSEKSEFEEFYRMIEEVYNGKDPLEFKEKLKSLKLSEELDPSIITLCLIQLFMSEQDINYTTGKVQPPRAFLMGYLRFIRIGEQNIDKILWSSIRHPPRTEFWRRD